MIVKICGIRSLDDALAAVDAGADMLGFNFYPPSVRYILPAACATLVDALRQARASLPILVGVFVNSGPAEIHGFLDDCGLDLAQLHGDEAPDTLAALNGRGFKALRATAIDAARAGIAAYRPARPPAEAPEILLDASAPGAYGGSGLTASWPLVAALSGEVRLLLAGGLHPGNVAQAIAEVHPWGVDVASGVESAPGVKDAAKMRSFVRQARQAAANSANSRNAQRPRAVRQ